MYIVVHAEGGGGGWESGEVTFNEMEVHILYIVYVWKLITGF